MPSVDYPPPAMDKPIVATVTGVIRTPVNIDHVMATMPTPLSPRRAH
jgi:hypothetical protein